MSTLTLRTLLKDTPEPDLHVLFGRWNGVAEKPGDRPGVVVALAECMADEARVQQRLEQLPKKLADLVRSFLEHEGHAQDITRILNAEASTFRSRRELEASLAALHREGFLFPARARALPSLTTASWAMPGELASCLAAMRRRQATEIAAALTLKGFLEQRYFTAENRRGDPERAADHARKIYKLYLMEGSIHSRIAKLPDVVRRVFDRALSGFGGIMPSREFDRFVADTEIDLDIDLVRKCFEENLIGTVAPLRLARFGIEPVEQAVVVFYEVGLLSLPALSDQIPCDVGDVLSSGVDLVTNVGRFLREVSGSKVQFTVEGNLYRASAKRIMKGFLEVPGGFMPHETQIRLIYRFALARRLIERSGERALRLSEAGHAFEQKTLLEKLRDLLAFCVEERAPQGEHYHQVRLRRILLRLLRRVQMDEWHEALFIPFLARNGYLSKIEETRVDGYFAARFRGGGYVPTENVMQVCRHLLDFVKRRLFPLGLIDLGLHEGRPVALRLSRLGAELLGADAAGEVGGNRSSIVINPDFEVILFPGDDEHEVVHSFDRFCERLKTDHIHHFKLCRETVQAALVDGMTLTQIEQDLQDRSRAPVPQNVIYSLQDWADQAGVLTIEAGNILSGRRPEPIDRFLEQTPVERFVRGRKSKTTVALRDDVDIVALQDVARDLGFFIECREEPA